MQPPAAMPWPATWCGQLELSGARPTHLDVPGPLTYADARILVRVHGEPVGYVTVPVRERRVNVREALEGLAAEAVARARGHLRAEGLDDGTPLAEPLPGPVASCAQPPAPQPLVSVVVCTRDRPDQLRSCLAGLRVLTYPNLEFLIVDNAPVDGRTRAVVEEAAASDSRFRHVLEPVPGLSRARNRGAAVAGGDVIAYTDDDVTVDPGWIEGVVRGFARAPDVACVTGLVCSASLTSAAEAYFDARVSWATAGERHVYRLSDESDDKLYPYRAGHFGTGANFSFKRAVLHDLDGFDEALGPGTPAGGGEDLDLFVRLLQAGHGLAYEPSALVWHHHRADIAALRRQMHIYGTGLTAFVTKHLMDRRTRGEVLRRVPAGLRLLMALPAGMRRSLEREGAAAPAGLLGTEFRGMLLGPALYLRNRKYARKHCP